MKLPDPQVELYVEVEPSKFILVYTAHSLEGAKDYLQQHFSTKRWYAVGRQAIASSR